MFPDTPFGVAAGIAYSALLVYAAVGDLRWRRIPNKLIATLVGLGLLYSLVAEPGPTGLLGSMAGFAVGLACWLPFYALGWLGAGDVKLFAAAGVWLGPLRALEGAGIAAVAGGILALLWMVWVYGIRNAIGTLSVATAVPSALAEAGRESSSSRRTLPYGVALAAGALAAAWMPRLLVFG